MMGIQVFIEKINLSKFSMVRVIERDEEGIATKTVIDNYLRLLVTFPALNRRKEYPVQVLLPADSEVIHTAIKTEGERLLLEKHATKTLADETQAYIKIIAGSDIDIDRVELNL